jgi:hypothetical protein
VLPQKCKNFSQRRLPQHNPTVRDRPHYTDELFRPPHALPRPLNVLIAPAGEDDPPIMRGCIASLWCDGVRALHTRMHKRAPRGGRRTGQLPSLRGDDQKRLIALAWDARAAPESLSYLLEKCSPPFILGKRPRVIFLWGLMLGLG